MNVKHVVFYLLVCIPALTFSLGGIDNVARFTVNHADDFARVVVVNADELVQAGLMHVDDGMRLGVLHADDIARLSVIHADDLAKLGLAQGDNLIYDFAKIHARANLVGRTVNNINDIALSGVSRASFKSAFSNGSELATDISAFTGKQFRKIQGSLRGDPVTARGFINGRYLEGNDFLYDLNQRANRLDNFLNSQSIKSSTTLLRGENLPENAVRALYGLDDINGKNLQEIASMIKTNGSTFNASSLTSASLRNVNRSLIDEFAVYGWSGNTGNFKIIRELSAPAGTKGFNVSQLSNVRGQQEFLMPRGLRTQVTNVIPEKVFMNGIEYDVLRVFETIIP